MSYFLFFRLTIVHFFDKISVEMCKSVYPPLHIENLIHGELSEWSKVQHSKCCVRNVPRVRIPNSPPKKSEKSRFFGLFFFSLLLKIGSKLWKE